MTNGQLAISPLALCALNDMNNNNNSNKYLTNDDDNNNNKSIILNDISLTH